MIGKYRTVYREDIADGRYPEEARLLELGVRSRVLAPLQVGPRAIGALVDLADRARQPSAPRRSSS